MLIYDKTNKKFYINHKPTTESDGRCIDCTQPTAVIKGDGLVYRVGCACDDGIDLRDVPTARQVIKAAGPPAAQRSK